VVGIATIGNARRRPRGGLERDRLAETDRRAAADRDRAVGAEPLRLGARRARGVDRHVHARFGEDADRAIAEQRGDAARRLDLLGRRQHQRARRADRLDLARELLQRAGAEDDARRQAV
jgi:hypothetical protein